LGATRPPNLMVLNSPERCCGPQVLDALITSRIGDMRELLLALRSCDGRKGGEPNRAPGVRFRWTAEAASRYCGPDSGCLWRFRGSGFRDVEHHETLTPRTRDCRKADATGSRATRRLDGQLLFFPAYNMGAIYCVNFSATSLFAISHQPLICSHGWIQTVDTIILLAYWLEA
jgi:hypothetical protein